MIPASIANVVKCWYCCISVMINVPYDARYLKVGLGYGALRVDFCSQYAWLVNVICVLVECWLSSVVAQLCGCLVCGFAGLFVCLVAPKILR